MATTSAAPSFTANHGLSLFIFVASSVFTWYAALLINQKHEPVGVVTPTTEQAIGVLFYMLGAALFWGKLFFVFATKK